MAWNPYNPSNKPNTGISHRQELPGAAEAHAHLLDHFYEISGDISGSDPALYLAPADVETLERYVAMQNELGWRNGTPLPRQEARFADTPGLRNFPAFRKPKGIGMAALTRAVFFPSAEEKLVGTIFGHLSVVPGQAVAIGQDGKLYSERGGQDAELVRSKSRGWGRLPNPEVMAPVLKRGQVYGVNYRNFHSYNLAQELQAKSGIPKSIFRLHGIPVS